MLTIQQMIRAVRDLQKRVDALEAAAVAEQQIHIGSNFDVVAPVPVTVRRGRPPKVVEPEPVVVVPEATTEI